MKHEAFRTYFDKTVWRSADSVPDREELRKMEYQCIKELLELREQDYDTYTVVFDGFFEKVLGRISYSIGKIERRLSHSDEVAVIRLLASYNRLLSGMRAEDRRMNVREKRDSGSSSSVAGKKPVAEQQPQLMVSSSARWVPHFTTLNIDEERAATLYDRLVQDGCIEDRSKKDFVYYYTGKGRKPVYQLKWRGDDILLSVLMEKLYPKGGRISWKTLGKVYEGLNTDSMKNVLSKTKKGEVVYTYDEHKKTVEEWLK